MRSAEDHPTLRKAALKLLGKMSADACEADLPEVQSTHGAASAAKVCKLCLSSVEYRIKLNVHPRDHR